MKGWRTLAFNIGVPALGAATQALGQIDWTQHLSPSNAVLAMAAVNIGLRFITTTPVGGKSR